MRGDHVLLITPFDDEGNIDRQSLANHIEFVLGNGVHGVVGLGTTGEFFTLSVPERKEVMSLITKYVNGRVPITFGVGDSATDAVIDLSQHAEKLGADCVMIQPPYYFSHSPFAIMEHFVSVANAISLPVMVYDGAGGIELSAGDLQQLNQGSRNISYAKLSTPKPYKVDQAVKKAENVRIFAGDDNMLILAYRYGAVGSTIGSGNLQPNVTSEIYNLVEKGDFERARQLHNEKICPAVSICGTSKSEYIRCFKEVLKAKGIIKSAHTRRPLLPLDPVRHEELLGVMRDLKVL